MRYSFSIRVANTPMGNDFDGYLEPCVIRVLL